MKKIILAFASLLMLVGCTTNKPAEAAVENVPFEVAKNYFFKNNQAIPASPKITTAEAFSQLATARFCSFSAPERKVTF